MFRTTYNKNQTAGRSDNRIRTMAIYQNDIYYFLFLFR